MGAFGSKKKIHLFSTVERFFDDNQLPETLKKSLYTAIRFNQDIPENLIAGMANGPSYQFEQGYTYAKNGHYYWGLPESWNSGYALNTIDYNAKYVQAALYFIQQDHPTYTQETLDAFYVNVDGILNNNFDIEYAVFSALSHDHLVWQHVYDTLNYDVNTNLLPTLLGTNGEPVYLHKVVSTYNIDPEDAATQRDEPPKFAKNAPLANTLPTAAGGLTLAQQMAINALSVGEQVEYRDGVNEVDGAEVHYFWIDENNVRFEQSIILDFSVSAYDTVPVTEPGQFDTISKDAIQFKYSYNHPDTNVLVVKYITYYPDFAGSPPARLVPITEEARPFLATSSVPFYSSTATYFPIVHIRKNGVDQTNPALEGTPAYDTSVKLVKKLGTTFDALGTAINSNADVDKIDYAVLMMAPNMDTTEQEELKYLFLYFKRMFNAKLPFVPTPPARWYSVRLNATIYHTWADADFKTKLRMLALNFETRSGVIGEVGEYARIIVLNSGDYIGNVGTRRTYLNALNPTGDRPSFLYQHQITPTLYEEVVLINVNQAYSAYNNKWTQANLSKMIAPMDMELVRQNFNMIEKEYLYFRSYQIITAAHVVEKIKWYQRSVFKAIITIIAIIIAIITMQPQIVAAVAAGWAAVAILIVKIVIMQIVLGYIARFVVKAIGIEAAWIIAIVALVTRQYQLLGEVTKANVAAAKYLLMLSSNMVSGANYVLKDDFTDLLKERDAFQLLAEEKQDTLDDLMAELEPQKLLDTYSLIGSVPLTIPNETPTEFYGRTIHAGNIGTISYHMIENYVDASLDLSLSV